MKKRIVLVLLLIAVTVGTAFAQTPDQIQKTRDVLGKIESTAEFAEFAAEYTKLGNILGKMPTSVKSATGILGPVADTVLLFNNAYEFKNAKTEKAKQDAAIKTAKTVYSLISPLVNLTGVGALINLQVNTGFAVLEAGLKAVNARNHMIASVDYVCEFGIGPNQKYEVDENSKYFDMAVELYMNKVSLQNIHALVSQLEAIDKKKDAKVDELAAAERSRYYEEQRKEQQLKEQRRKDKARQDEIAKNKEIAANFELKLNDGSQHYYIITKYIGKGGEVDIPEKYLNKPIREIAKRAFAGNKTITNVGLGCIYTIGESAFENCSSLTGSDGKIRFKKGTVYFPRDLQRIGANAFKNTKITALFFEDIYIPEIGAGAFSIPSLTSIGNNFGISTSREKPKVNNTAYDGAKLDDRSKKLLKDIGYTGKL